MEKITKLLKTLVPDSEGISSYDTIEYEDDLWLVPEWIDGSPSEELSRPARIIRITFLPRTGPFGDAQYVLRDPIPKGIFEGHVPPELKELYVVIENPCVAVMTPIDAFVQ